MNAGGIGDSRLGVNHEVTVGTEPTPRFTPTPDTNRGVASLERLGGEGVPSPFTLLPLG